MAIPLSPCHLPLGEGLRAAQVNALRELQSPEGDASRSASGEELPALKELLNSMEL